VDLYGWTADSGRKDNRHGDTGVVLGDKLSAVLVCTENDSPSLVLLLIDIVAVSPPISRKCVHRVYVLLYSFEEVLKYRVNLTRCLPCDPVRFLFTHALSSVGLRHTRFLEEEQRRDQG
jgi:hypothetical protein